MSTTQSGFCPIVAVAVEISSAKWLVGTYAGGKNVRKKQLSQEHAEDRVSALVSEIGKAAERMGAGEGTRVLVGYEAGQEGFWLARALLAAGIEAEVIDPTSLRVDRRARRAKTDRLDVEALAHALYAWMQNGKDLRMVRVPSLSDEDLREWQRERDRLESARRGGLDRIGKKLRTHGLWKWDVASLRAGTLRRFDGEPLGEMLHRVLLLELDRVEQIERCLLQLSQCLGKMTPEVQTRIEQLQRLKGIGRVGSVALALLLYWREFSNRRQVGSCVGLVGTPYDSGEMRQDQGISKQGDPRLRGLLIELSWMWLRYQPNSAITQWFAERTQGQGKRHKRIMIVAVARRLAIALWRYLRDGVIPAGAQLKAG